jgi:hypothetical protein
MRGKGLDDRVTSVGVSSLWISTLIDPRRQKEPAERDTFLSDSGHILATHH